jgi:ribose/xylose/arabinose/galactoside ABC-type transport system permease subunit
VGAVIVTTGVVSSADSAIESDGARAGRGLRVLNWTRVNVVYLALILLCIAFSIASPYFLTVDNLRVVLLQASITAIVACGLTFVVIAGDIDLSVGSMYALAATLAAILLTSGWNPYLAVLTVLAAGVLVGAINGVLSVFAGIPSFLVTLGTLGVGAGLALIISQTRAIPIPSVEFNSLFAGEIGGFPLPILWGAVVAVAAWLVLSRTVFGRYVTAVGGDAETSRLMGLPVARVRFVNFILCAVLASLAGLVIAARLGAGSPTIGNNLELDVITAVILGGTALFGGRGTITGTIIGVFAITVMGNGLVLIGADVNVQTCAKGAILIATVLLRGKAKS